LFARSQQKLFTCSEHYTSCSEQYCIKARTESKPRSLNDWFEHFSAITENVL